MKEESPEEVVSIPEGKKTKINWIVKIFDFIKYPIIVLAIVVPIRFFVIQPFAVHGKSMFPTFDSYDYLLVEKIDYYLSEPKRGDVIIFRYPKEPGKFFIKRIIGLPGEKVKIEYGKIFVSSPDMPEQEINQDYVVLTKENEVMNTQLEKDEYFVMGDNRKDSLDSRSWGPLPRKNIVGKVWIRLYPLDQIGIFPGGIKQN